MTAIEQELAAALRLYEEALADDPQNPDLHCLVGMLRLSFGDFAGGWPEFEWRWKTGRIVYPQLGAPVWDGSSLDGKTILLAPEQGIGDVIQFIRYARWLKDRYRCRVLASCVPRLEEFLSACEGVDQWVGSLPVVPRFDCYATMMQIPAILKHGWPANR